ncbi:DYW family of nucleic acid deaminases-domain-containing protein [Aspergillus keveii]|uniref:DYW family of nucleic acid deaminases-domain-containing protein n=1 Tax=Aspergillus keveii TaxID=714993 RepID=A0ABR4FP26_9EURO
MSMRKQFTRTSPSVDVIRWDASNFWVRCPYCEEIHRHGFVSYESGWRVPHCGLPRPSYRYSFPAAYEIDKAKARFVNISAGPDSDDDSDDSVSLPDQFSNLDLSNTTNESRRVEVSFDDSREKVTISLEDEEPFDTSRILFAMSACVTGNTHEVNDYLETSSEKSIFLGGRNRDGDTTLIMAARERSTSMVRLLLDHGSDVNATNDNGRTALMEASLWGRLETTETLLSRGADGQMRDNRKMTALNLAQPTWRNQKERHTKAGGVWGGSIARILQGERPPSTAPRELPEFHAAHHSFQRSSNGQSVVHFGPIREFHIPKPSKTIAVLQRPSPFPAITAMSGWGHLEDSSTTVSGKDWTERVFQIAAAVGHTFDVNTKKDQGTPGKFNASHAEKQLIAYLLDRHVFLPEDTTPDPRFDEEIDRLDDDIAEMTSQHPIVDQFDRLQKQKRELHRELFNKDDPLLGEDYDPVLVEQLKSKIAMLDEQLTSISQPQEIRVCEGRKELHSRLNRLSEIAPKDRMTETTILISAPDHLICSDCSRFKNSVNRVLGLSITLHERTM